VVRYRQWRKFVHWDEDETVSRRHHGNINGDDDDDDQRNHRSARSSHRADGASDDDESNNTSNSENSSEVDNSGRAARGEDDDVDDDDEPPRKIDNSSLVVSTKDEWSPLRDGLCEGVDFELVPETVWFFLDSWYGGSPVVVRESVPIGPNKQAIVELYPLTLVGVPFALENLVGLVDKLSLAARFSSPQARANAAALAHFNASESQAYTVRVSKTCTIDDLRARFATLMRKNKTTVRLHAPPFEEETALRVDAGGGAAAVKAPNNGAAPAAKSLRMLDDPYSSVQDAMLQSGARLLCEISSGDDDWPLSPPLPPSRWNTFKRSVARAVKGITKLTDDELNGVARSKADGSGHDDVAPRLHGGDAGGASVGAGDDSEKSSRGSGAKKTKKQTALVEVDGMCGLKNLGNTCYMNSAVQALSMAPPFRRFFLSERYVTDLNKDNPLGTKGKVAEAYASLLVKLWSGDFRSVSPVQLRSAIGKAESRFDSFQQQDSQELMAFLLDALHEDLNRVRDKPYIEQKAAAGRPDDVVAAEAWSDHTRRNKSIVVDLFQGQLRSELTCPTCHQQSVTFDPFMFLSLPLPSDSKRTIEVVVLRYMSHAQQTKYAVSIPKRCRMEVVRQCVGEVVGMDPTHIIIASFARSTIDSWLIDHKQAEEVLDSHASTIAFEVPDRSVAPLLRVQFYHRVRELVNGYSRQYVDNRMIGLPFVVYFPRDGTTALRLYELALEHCERYLRVNTDTSSDEDDDTPDFVEDEDEDEDADVDDKNGAEDEAVARGVGVRQAVPEAPVAAASSYDSARSSEGGPPPAAAGARSFPFVVRMVAKDGRSCSVCQRVQCSGCILEASERVVPFDKPGSFLVLDWKPRVLHRDYRRSAISSVQLDKTVHEARESRQLPHISLSSCFNLFSAPERLSAQDEWYCGKCAAHVRATKMLTLWKLPPLLIIHLKRFSYGSLHSMRQKLQHQVDCPLDSVDLAPFVLGGDGAAGVYRLVAVINHVGGIGGGHYFTYARGCDPGNPDQWYEFNDMSVTALKGDVVTQSAYIVLYERVSVGAGTMPLPAAPQPSNGVAKVANGSGSATPEGKKRVKKRVKPAHSNGATTSNGSDEATAAAAH
jgi:ubiquitin C-terminal hydrolase